MRDEVGAMITEGMAVGITDETQSAVDAMQDMSSATFGALENNDLSVGNTDVVSLLQQLVNKDSNIYLDGNTLVGGISDRMDKALYQNQMKGARGV